MISSIKTISSRTGAFILVVSMMLALGGFGTTAFGETVSLFYNSATPQHAFAAGDIRAALEARKVTVEVQELSSLTGRFAGKKVVIALASDPQVVALLV